MRHGVSLIQLLALQGYKNRTNDMTIWEFLNSNFGLWVLSSVLLAGLSKLFIIWKESSNRKAVARSEIEDLFLEIEVRTQTAIASAENPKNIHLAVSGPLKGPISKYDGRKYLQLLIEAECRLGNLVKAGTLTQRGGEIAKTDENNPDDVNRMISLYKEILTNVRDIRAKD